MFKFEKNPTNKVMTITVSGFFSAEDAKNYVAEYQRQVRSIVPSQYTLIVNGSDQKVTAQNLMEEFQGAVDMYLASKFKQTIIVLPSSAVATMQIKKLRGVEKADFAKTLQEAQALIGRTPVGAF